MSPLDGEITFNIKGSPVLEFKPNGDILVHGKKIDNDLETIIAFREFLITTDIGLITNKDALRKANDQSRQYLRGEKIKSIFK